MIDYLKSQSVSKEKHELLIKDMASWIGYNRERKRIEQKNLEAARLDQQKSKLQKEKAELERQLNELEQQ